MFFPALVHIAFIFVIISLYSINNVDGNVLDNTLNLAGSLSNAVGQLEGGLSGDLSGAIRNIVDGGVSESIGQSAKALATSLSKSVNSTMDKISKLSSTSGRGNKGAYYNYMYPENDDYPWACPCDERDFADFMNGLRDNVRCRNQLDLSLQYGIPLCDPENHLKSAKENENVTLWNLLTDKTTVKYTEPGQGQNQLKNAANPEGTPALPDGSKDNEGDGDSGSEGTEEKGGHVDGEAGPTGSDGKQGVGVGGPKPQTQQAALQPDSGKGPGGEGVQASSGGAGDSASTGAKAAPAPAQGAKAEGAQNQGKK